MSDKHKTLLERDNLLWTHEGRERILALMSRAEDVERERCLSIVRAARFGETSQDFRSIIYHIENGGELEQSVDAPDRLPGQLCCECGLLAADASPACKFPGNHQRPLGVDLDNGDM